MVSDRHGVWVVPGETTTLSAPLMFPTRWVDGFRPLAFCFGTYRSSPNDSIAPGGLQRHQNFVAPTRMATEHRVAWQSTNQPPSRCEGLGERSWQRSNRAKFLTTQSKNKPTDKSLWDNGCGSVCPSSRLVVRPCWNKYDQEAELHLSRTWAIEKDDSRSASKALQDAT